MKPLWSIVTLILALGAVSAVLAAGWPSHVTPVAVQKGKTVTVKPDPRGGAEPQKSRP